MLELVARHGAMDLEIDAKGDLDVDQHHTVEDLGIALGEAVTQGAGLEARHPARGLFSDAHGRNAGVRRPSISAGARTASCQWQFSRAASATCRPNWSRISFAASRRRRAANVHLRLLYGRSSHHQVEALFKAFARALRFAATRDPPNEARAAEHEGAAVNGAMKISLVEYDAGNLPSVERALARQGIETERAATPEAIAAARRADAAGRGPLWRN